MARLKSPKKAKAARDRADFLDVLSRSIVVIEALGETGKAKTLSEIARATALPKPSVGRVLYTLSSLGYVKLVDRDFLLTPKVLRLASTYLGVNGTGRVLKYVCDKVSLATGQPCLAGVLSGDDVEVVANSTSEQLMGMPTVSVGMRLPSYCTGAGRLLLSGLADKELDEYLMRVKPVSHTQSTLLDKRRIKREILEARKLGYCSVEDEFSLGWRTVSCPLLRFDGTVFGALSLDLRKTPELTERKLSQFFNVCSDWAKEAMPLLT